MRVVLVRPPVVNLRNSPFGSTPGVPSNLAYLGGVLLAGGHSYLIVDSYGLAPHRFSAYKGRFEARGLLPPEAVSCIPPDVEMIGISCHCTLEHGMTLWLVAEAKKRFPDVPVVIGGYHTTFCYEPFLAAGADYVLQGEGEHRLPMLIDHLERGREFALDGIHSKGGCSRDRIPTVIPIEDMPFADFDSLPLDEYWSLHYAHGPVQTGRYLSMFTSRGCPYACAFCQTPRMWGGKWMAKSPRRVVDEMDYYALKHGVRDFHIQDENFSLSRSRSREFALELLARRRRYTYCFPSGIKAETVGYEELVLWRRSGCRYFALSPESGSPRVLDLMNKKVDLEHVFRVVSWCNELGIRVNCNFVLGFPGEESADRKLTYRYLRRLVRAGLDEVVTFMLTPLPETAVAGLMPEGLEYEDINFSPTWRDNYDLVTRARRWMYLQFFLLQALWHPGKLIRNLFCLFRRRFTMKGDMTAYRFLVDLWDRYPRRMLGESSRKAPVLEWRIPPDGTRT
ncbi:B12-binding domain-containing radical SAM protein [Candidatus Fermentibacteria bacterium]|nr:B12-binding domain-containing radical SAM protein [Candidatus Fermentibacteria bacterium]